MRRCRASSRPRSREELGRTAEPPSTARGRACRARSSRRRSPRRSARARLAGAAVASRPAPLAPGPSRGCRDERRPVRAPQGPDHRLVGRDDRRSRLRPEPVRARRPTPVDDGGDCQNCRLPPGEGVRVRMLKDYAFHVVGTEQERDELDRSFAQVGDRRMHAPPAAGGRSPRRRASTAPLAQVGESPSSCCSSPATAVAEATSRRPDRLPPGRPELGRPGRRPHEPPVPRPVRPAADPAPRRRGARRRRAVRHPRGRVPVVPPRPRGEPLPRAARLGGRRRRWPSRRGARARRSRSGSCPRAHEADFGRAATPTSAPARTRCARCSAASARRLDGPPYNLVLHTAPLRERVDATFHWHWEVHPRLREIAGLELGTGLPVNPVSPEAAVEELLERAAGPARGRSDRPRLPGRAAGGRRHTRPGPSSLRPEPPPPSVRSGPVARSRMRHVARPCSARARSASRTRPGIGARRSAAP